MSQNLVVANNDNLPDLMPLALARLGSVAGAVWGPFGITSVTSNGVLTTVTYNAAGNYDVITVGGYLHTFIYANNLLTDVVVTRATP